MANRAAAPTEYRLVREVRLIAPFAAFGAGVREAARLEFEVISQESHNGIVQRKDLTSQHLEEYILLYETWNSFAGLAGDEPAYHPPSIETNRPADFHPVAHRERTINGRALGSQDSDVDAGGETCLT